MSFRGLPGLLRRGRCFFHVPLGSCQIPPLHHSWWQKKSTATVQHNSVKSLTDKQSLKTLEDALCDMYSSEQQSSILQVLNTASERELSAIKLLQGRKLVNVIEYREKHGQFQNLQCLFKVPLFQYKTVVKVCNFILNPDEERKRRERGKKTNRPPMRIIKPEIERERLETLNSIVSIVFGTRKIAWAHVNRKLAVQDWQQKECDRFMTGPYLPTVYLEEISSVVSRIPKADFYILEKNGLPAQNLSLFPVTLHLRTVEAMLYALLHNTFMQDGQHRVLSMPRNSVGRHFGLMVGDFRTSGMDLVKQFLLQACTQRRPQLSFPQDKMLYYRSLFSVSQVRAEEMYDSLLQALAFYELIVFNNTT
uniref:Transcription elongation factor, mitochondrial n=1 Tax=Pelusios castaneus TaxID=367368 RepID=A0A8C8RBB2_9SAUR